ncbi:MAG: hypothetical protein LBC90_00005, partial [Candidatus Adiutrix sp.]|nr:hypothetical protein [Candidatus Adiutrix sp.]
MAAETHFQAIAEAMLDYHRQDWDPDYWAKAKSRLETYVFPILGPLPVDKIDRVAVKTVLDSIHARGLSDTLKKTKTQISYVFRYAIDQGIEG